MRTAQLEPTVKLTADGCVAGQQNDPTSNQYSRAQMASIASQLIKYEGDASKVVVLPDPIDDVDLSTPEDRSAEIARLTEEFLARGGEIEQVPPAEDSWTPSSEENAVPMAPMNRW